MFDQFDTKRILLIAIAMVVAFLLFMVIAFYLYPLINPDAANKSVAIEVQKSPPDYYEFDYIRFGPAAVHRLNKKIDQLEAQLTEEDEKEQQQLANIDSLYRVTREQREEMARLEGQTTQNNRGNRSIFASSGGGDLSGDPQLQNISRSLLILDEDELGPILNRLSDAQLVRLYNASSNNRRAKLMRSLDPGKAALLLRRVMG